MRRRLLTASALLTLLTSSCRPPAGGSSGEGPATSPIDPVAIVAEADRMARADLWPGFDPRSTPVAIHDGARTFLFRHPAPPDGFAPLSGRGDVLTYDGRHPAVTANSSAKIAGIETATLIPPGSRTDVAERAGSLIHELFHVFQRSRHPAWSANEVELFTYPMDDVSQLALRRQESEALRRALAAPNPSQAACWAHEALELRRARFTKLTSGAARYERASEWNEGLANYVELRALRAPDEAIMPADAFAPEALRQRSYATGAAFGRLLDRFVPDWRGTLERIDSIPLDAMLATALENHAPSEQCALDDAERRRIESIAEADVAALRTRRAAQRRDFIARDGWTLVVTSAAAPLWPNGFDPWNVSVVGPSEVLHTRWLKLGNDAGTVEVLDRSALTAGAGTHPLFNGVKTLTVTGLDAEPLITQQEGVLTVRSPGVTADFRGATVDKSTRTITVRLP